MIKNKLKIKFHNEPVYEYKYLKTKVKEYAGAMGKLKENIHYTTVAKMDEKYFPRVYLEECKYKTKKIKTSRFINSELDSDSDDDDSDSYSYDFDSGSD